ncbi:hypothetical protein [Pelagibacterium limicola]|uniref:hypothetical protein n=1 Tax=Pelagibacterium limicola TaxID=2791022 RepID=UPI0018B01499|nr:hypothetical protein [Pelagibacterium limicola]
MKNVIVYLLGHYGVGKYTVGKQLSALTGAKLVDNHLINNVIFSLLRVDGKTPLPEAAWDRILVIREQVIATIAEIAPREQSYVFTNMLAETDEDRALYTAIVELAEGRGNLFVPVRMSCKEDALDLRIGSPDREERLKHTDAASARDMRRRIQLLEFAHPHALDLDTTLMTPEYSARHILSHIEGIRK